MFSLKFCTAIECPAPISTWPRCCSSAFIGTTKNPPHGADRRSCSMAASGTLCDEDHRDHDDAHQRRRSAARSPRARSVTSARRAPRRSRCRRRRRPAGRRLRQVVAERVARPVDDDELQRRAGAPEQRRRRERDLAQPVAPQQRHAMRELADQVERILARHRDGRRRCRGMNQLMIAAMHIEDHDDAIAASGGVSMPVSMSGKSKPSSAVEIAG